ncbi:O-antigen ligase family protein [Flavobacterium limnosediminis]|uniref:O-antigen ligase family protein n=1 Tax=Flavobacterium limnosediminis TaxID=1401027 RepID=UPI0004121785|nr:O-antigen ligase family protein [Flavobacterium limnosediminis]
MKNNESNYISLLLIHVGIGLLVFVFPFLSKIYSICIFGFGIYYLNKTQNRNNEALILSAYVMSIEVLLRMTGGMHINEYGKYSIILFMLMGIYFTGLKKSSAVYWIFLLLLVPGMILSTFTLSYQADIRKAIAFNISGPICLGISAIYCYRRQITFDRLLDVLTVFGFPLISILTYVYLYNPSIKDTVTGTQSNFETSGGFGPNQMSTILGFGIFIFFVQFLLRSSTTKLKIINGILVLLFAFRGIVTFSRGGVMTAGVMIVLLLLVLYFQTNIRGRSKLMLILVFTAFATLGVWTYSSLQTSGLIDKRYANQDARGRVKASKLTGREKLIESEWKMFLDNPILGIGVGKNKEYREELTGIESASHNEITRMLAEHGSLGVFCLLILLLTPLVLYLDNRQHIFMLSFMVFWLLTINHAAMRLAAPAFVYALSLLKVYAIEKPAVPRE